MEPLDRLWDKLDSIESKLDAHLDRLSQAEEAIRWLKAHVRAVTGAVIAVLTGVIVLYIRA